MTVVRLLIAGVGGCYFAVYLGVDVCQRPVPGGEGDVAAAEQAHDARDGVGGPTQRIARHAAGEGEHLPLGRDHAAHHGQVVLEDLAVRPLGELLAGVAAAVKAEEQRKRPGALVLLRDLQDETGGFTAFIPWPFQPDNTAYSEISKASAYSYLKMLAW